MRVQHGIAIAAAAALAGSAHAGFIGFNEVSAGSQYTLGGVGNQPGWPLSGQLELSHFYRPSGGIEFGGNITITDQNTVGGQDNQAILNSIRIKLQVVEAINELSFRFEELESGINFTLNNQFRVVNSLADLNGQVFDGATVNVSNGMVEITGPVTRFEVGGTSLALDEIAFVPSPGAMATLGLAGLVGIRRRR